MKQPHTPVLLKEVLHYFEGTIKTFFEGTVGAGGHAAHILHTHPEIEQYLACDQDSHALEIAQKTLKPYEKKICWFQGNFSNLDRFAKEAGVEQVDGFLFDLGVSSMQLDQQERGFSFKKEAKLDMRMDNSQETTAHTIVNSWSLDQLSDLFKNGEEPYYRKAANSIVEARRKGIIETTTELAEIIEQALPKYGKLHPATLVFQALRIAVNRELEVIEIALKKAMKLLAPHGKIGVISFHSLEDRIVKNIFKSASEPEKNYKGQVIKEALFERLTKKAVQPSFEEMRSNPRSRSAKFRMLARLGF
ncbi:MAG: 16S rRNA (cytosine(1402)-N(4))-methyltransferase RsmH [Chlamydiia bacterium]